MPDIKVIHGKCEEVLKDFADNHFDSVVCDPPYGISFMNKHWDYKVPSVGMWQEIIRVLKPGGHMLCACGTRTQHRMAVNIEDAGFEIRDVITWHYSTGFPKSLNVNKYLDDKICNCEEAVSGKSKAKYNMRPMQQSDISKKINFEEKQGEILQSGLPEQSTHSTMQRFEAKQGNENGEKSCMEGRHNLIQEEGELQERGVCESDGVGITDGEEGWLHNGTQESDGSTMLDDINKNGSGSSHRPQTFQQRTKEFGTLSDQCDTQSNGAWKNCSRCGKPILPDGIGTALKPATEFWTLARKPLSESTVAENVLKHGTGGINIDGCRIEGEEITGWGGNPSNGYSGGLDNKQEARPVNGRFPSNLILDEFMAEELDKQSGITTSGDVKEGGWEGEYKGSIYGQYAKNILNPESIYADTGGASRFFYVAKPSQFERNKGLNNFDPQQTNDGRNKLPDNAFQRGRSSYRNNNHPTVKPIELMRYLVKLITPKYGNCLDPFCGSGTTLIACKLELINATGIEMDEGHCKIAEARVAAWNPERYIEQTLF